MLDGSGIVSVMDSKTRVTFHLGRLEERENEVNASGISSECPSKKWHSTRCAMQK